MTLSCPRCARPLGRQLARRTDDGWACADRSACAAASARERRRQQQAAITADRLEDLRWLVDTGECATGAARRLGISLTALEKWCRRHARDEWRRLLAREPRDINRDHGNQWRQQVAS